MNAQRKIFIDPLSCVSLFIQPKVNGIGLASATGFIVNANGINYLITNWHVVTGRSAETEKPLSDSAGIPDTIKIVHHHCSGLGAWKITDEPLFDADGNKRWIEHPNHNDSSKIDVIALPLSCEEDVKFFPLDLSLAETDLIPRTAMAVSIIGYPKGLSTGGHWPIWKTGHIASDPDIDYQDKPAFLIDATTRTGMSGSPVLLRSNGGFETRSGTHIIAGGITTLFLGIYSGRISKDIEVGMIWRYNIIRDILSIPPI